MFYLEFGHGTEVVVSEEHAEFPLLDGGRELTQAVIGQLRGRAVKELLRHEAWHNMRHKDTHFPAMLVSSSSA